MIAADREGAAVEALREAIRPLIRLDVERHESQTIRDAAIRDRAELVAKIARAVIAAGWVPESEVTERERAAVEKALRDAADEMVWHAAGRATSASHWRAHGWANWLRDRAEQLGSAS